MSDIIWIDTEDGLKRVVGNKKLYAKLLSKFKEDINLTILEDALAEGDMEKAKNAAHTLKGLAANLSLKELHKQSMEIDNQIKDNQVAPNKIEEVKDAFSSTINEIEKVIAQYE